MKTCLILLTLLSVILPSLAHAQRTDLRPPLKDVQQRVNAMVYGQLKPLPQQTIVLQTKLGDETKTEKIFKVAAIGNPVFFNPDDEKQILKGMSSVMILSQYLDDFELDDNGYGYFSIVDMPTTIMYVATDLSPWKEDPLFKQFQKKVQDASK